MTARLETLSTAPLPAFVATLGGIFEHSPWVAERAWARRPFADLDALHAAMLRAVAEAPEAEQVALIRAHPDLAGKLARAGALGAQSTAEQAGLGLDRLSDAEYARFDALNRAYRERFGFPFVIAVRNHSRASILDAFARRLQHDRGTEIVAALAEIAAIARFRLRDLLGDAA